MPYTRKDLDGSQVELTITVTPAEYEKHLKDAANVISEKAKIKGFRPGKAPFDVVKKEFGDMGVLQEALEAIIRESYYLAVMGEKLDTLGMPQISVEKVAPGNDIVYKATVALMPSVKLPDISKIKVTRDAKPVEEKQISETLDALRGMQAEEVATEEAAREMDKVVIDMNMFLDKVPVDGGQAKDYQVYLSEAHYIPGFNEKIVGIKKGETKEFSLDFPKEHYQKHLAGKKVDFSVTAKDVFERRMPELNDEFAKKLGLESVKKLQDLVRDNLTKEAHEKATQKAEIEILDTLVEKTKFDPIPEVLINGERQKMFHELKRDLDKNGISIEKYLEDIKKSEKDLFEDFKAQAEKRAKAALISRQIAVENNIKVDDADIDGEIEMMLSVYGQNPQYAENIKRPEVRDTIAVSLQNKKVMQFLRAKILGEEMMHDKNLSKLASCCNHDHKDGDACDHDHNHDHSHDHDHAGHDHQH